MQMQVVCELVMSAVEKSEILKRWAAWVKVVLNFSKGQLGRIIEDLPVPHGAWLESGQTAQQDQGAEVGVLWCAQVPREWGVLGGEGWMRSEEQQGPVHVRPRHCEDLAIILSQLAASGECEVGGACPHRISLWNCVPNSLQGGQGRGQGDTEGAEEVGRGGIPSTVF